MSFPRTYHLCVALLGLALALGCNRAPTEEDAREAADELRTAASQAGERLADGWLTTKVQAQFFADDDIKARYIGVTTRDGVVTLKGHVESEAVREQALQIARNTDGVRSIQDQMQIGQPGTSFTMPESAPVATTGADAPIVPSPAAPEPARLDDDSIETRIQAQFFLDDALKSRAITVDASRGVVTLRGTVASDAERAVALIVARMAEGVQRVEDALTIDASLGPSGTPEATGTSGTSVATLEVSMKDGVMLLQGPVADEATRQRTLASARAFPGVVQVVDQMTVVTR